MPAPQPAKTILEPNGTEISTRAGGARRYRKLLKHLRWCDIKSLLLESLSAWNRHNDTRLGASLALYALLSLAPLVLVIISIVGLVFGHTAAQRELMRDAGALIGATGANAIGGLLNERNNTSHGVIATVLGLVTLLFSASGVVIELRQTLNSIWEVPTPDLSGMQMLTSFVKQRLFSFAIVVGIGFLLIVSLAVSTWISALGALSASAFPGEQFVLHIVNGVVSFVIVAGLFAAVYKVMPDVHIEWRDVVLGGAVNSLLFTAGKLLLGLYLGHASYVSIYGAAGSIVVLIVWVYYSAQIFFLGAEFTRAFALRYGSHLHGNSARMVQAPGQASAPEAKVVTASVAGMTG